MRRFFLTSAVMLIVFGLLIAAEPAQSEAPTMSVDEIEPGMTGHGRTVFNGSRVDTFPVTVEGVLENVFPDQDLILIRSDGDRLDQTNIIAGMSGSPVFLNGRLIGALGYSWAFQSKPIAAVTPVSAIREARRLGGTTASEAGVRSLPTPVVASGFSGSGRQRLEKLLQDQVSGELKVQAGGSSKTSENLEYQLQPGAPVGIQLMRGDLSLTSVGTLTFRDEGQVYLFGHPFLQAGEVDLPLTEAYVHTVMPSLQSSFKLSSPGDVIGAVREDRQATVVGELGEEPDMLPVRIQTDLPGEGYSEDHQVQVARHRNLTPGLVSMAVREFANSGLQQIGSNRLTARVKIKLPDRDDIQFETVSVSPSSSPMRALLPMGPLWNNPFGEFQPQAVEVDLELTKREKTARIDRIWTDRTSVSAGDTVAVHVSLEPFRGQRTTRSLEVSVPEKLERSRLRVSVVPGDQLRRMAPQPEDLDDIVKYLNQPYRADQLAVVLEYPGETVERDGYKLQEVPKSKLGWFGRETRFYERKIMKERTEWVINGAGQSTLSVR